MMYSSAYLQENTLQMKLRVPAGTQRWSNVDLTYNQLCFTLCNVVKSTLFQGCVPAGSGSLMVSILDKKFNRRQFEIFSYLPRK